MDDLRTRLTEEGQRRIDARKEASAASAELTKLARQARTEGMSKIEIATLAQLSRPALNTMLND